MLHGLLNARLVGLLLHGNQGHFRVVEILLLDDLANRIGIAIAVQYKEFDVFSRECVSKLIGTGNPVAVRGVAGIAKRAVD